MSETNDDSLGHRALSYGTARVLLARPRRGRTSTAQSGSYMRPYTVVNVPKPHTLRAKVPGPAYRGSIGCRGGI